MHGTIGIDVRAPADDVFKLARGVERWSRLLPHYSRSRVIERRPDGSLIVEFVARRPFLPLLGLGLPVAWRARTWNDPARLRLRFVHVAGATAGMDVTWRIEPTEAGCRVSIEHDFEPRFEPFAPFVDRLFIRPIAGKTLSTFKALAEALAEPPPAPKPPPGESGAARPTNPST